MRLHIEDCREASQFVQKLRLGRPKAVPQVVHNHRTLWPSSITVKCRCPTMSRPGGDWCIIITGTFDNTRTQLRSLDYRIVPVMFNFTRYVSGHALEQMLRWRSYAVRIVTWYTIVPCGIWGFLFNRDTGWLCRYHWESRVRCVLG